MNQKTRSKPLFINKVEDSLPFRTTLNVFKVCLFAKLYTISLKPPFFRHQYDTNLCAILLANRYKKE